MLGTLKNNYMVFTLSKSLLRAYLSCLLSLEDTRTIGRTYWIKRVTGDHKWPRITLSIKNN